MRIACWIPMARNTHSEYVILIAFPLQQWLLERASMLRYTYIACLAPDYSKQKYRPKATLQQLRHSPRQVSTPDIKFTFPKMRESEPD